MPNKSAAAPSTGCTMAKVKANTEANPAAVAMLTPKSLATCGSTGSSARVDRLAAKVASAMMLRTGGMRGSCGRMPHVRAINAPLLLASASNAISVRTRPSNSRSGTMLGPSDGAWSGSGWVSMNTPATPTATAARASTGTNSRSPPDEVPLPPGCCTEWVASKITGAPVVRARIGSARISDTSVL